MIFNLLTGLYLLEAIGLIIIGILAFIRRKSTVQLAFFFFAVSTGIWQLLQALSIATANNREVSVNLFLSSITFSAVMATFLYLFTKVYAGAKPRYLLLIPAILIGSLAFLSSDLHRLVITSSGIGVPKLDIYYGLVLLYDGMLLIASIIGLIRFYRTTTSQKERVRTRIILSGTGIAGLIIVLFSFYTSDFSSTLLAQQVVPVMSFLAMLSFLYAVVYRDLFDIHIFVLRAAAYVTTYFFVAVTLALPVVYFTTVFLGRDVSFLGLIGLSLLTVIAMYLLQFLRGQLDKLTSSIFFRKLYDVQALLDEHNAVLVAQRELTPLLRASLETITKYIEPESTTIYINETENLPSHSSSTGRVRIEKTELESLSKQLESFKTQTVILTDELGPGSQDLKEYLSERGVALILRLSVPSDHKAGRLGYLVMGLKKNGDTYGKRDTLALQIVVNELSIAVQNAIRFDDIKVFNENLKKRIEEATKELRNSNSKLRKLDETKDEFLSMASHQLRTPLTSVKGYISMVLEGDAGRISADQQKLLEQAFESSQRMVFLIGDFLNVSRIQSGKFVIELSDMNMTEVVKQEVNQLVDTAKIRGISINFEPPETPITLQADDNKLRQVMMNFMDNAIYYGKRDGHINVQLYKDKDSAVFKVVDDGIGVPKEAQKKLFTKFFRAGNARTQRPDGTGIGIYMAQKVVLALGGTIIFESVEGKGSTFGFKLPLKNSPEQLDQ